MTIRKQSLILWEWKYMGCVMSDDSLLNERIQCVEGLIMYSLEMNDILSHLSKDQLRRDILLK